MLLEMEVYGKALQMRIDIIQSFGVIIYHSSLQPQLKDMNTRDVPYVKSRETSTEGCPLQPV